LYEVITNSAGNSWMFENRMAHVLAGDYTPLSAVDIFVKDLGLVLDTARASKFPLPLASHRAPDVHAGLHRRLCQGR
jgi:putative dehydrogenase